MLVSPLEVETSVSLRKMSGGTLCLSQASSAFSRSSLTDAYIALLGLLKPAISLFL